ncbi:hypothetical protein ACI2JR_04940 [Klebsiella sp. NPDC088457]
MNYQKHVIGTLDTCYAVSSTTIGSSQKLIFATEAHGGCYLYDMADKTTQAVWKEPGGTLSIAEIPGTGGDFLAVQNFFPVYQAAESNIVWVHPQEDGTFKVTPFLDIPYVHRFGIIRIGEKNFIIIATLCTSKQSIDDWSDPGKVLVGELPDSPDGPLSLHVLMDGLTRNHGFWQGTLDGEKTFLISSDEGVFGVCPPETPAGQWRMRPLLNNPTGDVAAVDIDGDGVDELLTIEAFHGNQAKIYKKQGNRYEAIWEYPGEIAFGHVAWGGKLKGEPVFICGYRAEKKELFEISYHHGEFKTQIIDSGQGPSNVYVLQQNDREIILAANRENNEAVIYSVS